MTRSSVATDVYHHGNLREELLDEALRVIGQKGVDELSLRQLARSANVSPGAPRSHFRSKQALLDAVSAKGFEQLQDLLEQAARDGSSFGERVFSVSSAYVHFGLENSNLLNLMTTKHIVVGGSDAFSSARSDAYNVFLRMIPEGQAAGLVRPGAQESLGVPFFAAIHGVTMLLAAGALPRERQDEIVRQIVSDTLEVLAPLS